MSLWVKASEIASSGTPACFASVAPVCLNLCGEAVYSKSNDYDNINILKHLAIGLVLLF